MVTIVPTIGRKLWLFIDPLRPRRADYENVVCHDERQAFDASVAYVHPDQKGTDFIFVTVTFFDHAARLWNATVPLRQLNQVRPDSREWCEWMPYQAGQAKKNTPPTIEEAVAVLQEHAKSLGLELVDPTAHTAPLPEADPLPKFLTLENIEDAIVGENFHAVPGTTVTYCTLFLRNGAKVVGHNYGAIDPNRQDWELGRASARAMAVEKVWELEGYLRIQSVWEQESFAPA